MQFKTVNGPLPFVPLWLKGDVLSSLTIDVKQNESPFNLSSVLIINCTQVDETTYRLPNGSVFQAIYNPKVKPKNLELGKNTDTWYFVLTKCHFKKGDFLSFHLGKTEDEDYGRDIIRLDEDPSVEQGDWLIVKDLRILNARTPTEQDFLEKLDLIETQITKLVDMHNHYSKLLKDFQQVTTKEHQ